MVNLRNIEESPLIKDQKKH